MRRLKRRIKKVALAGGPGAAKTEISTALMGQFPGRILVVPEAASQVLKVFPRIRDSPHTPTSYDWGLRAQRAILKQQVELEAVWEEEAQDLGVDVLACDRGLADGAGYLGLTFHEFCARFRLNPHKVYGRYTRVIHLQTYAARSHQGYEACRVTNPERLEGPERALFLDQAMLTAWSDHPDHHFVGATDSLAEKLTRVVDLFRPLLLA